MSSMTSIPSPKIYSPAEAPTAAGHNWGAGAKLERSQSAPAVLDRGQVDSVTTHASSPLTAANLEKLSAQKNIDAEASTLSQSMRDHALAARKKAVKKIVLASLGGAFLAATFVAVAVLCPFALIFVAPVTVYGGVHLTDKIRKAWMEKLGAEEDLAQIAQPDQIGRSDDAKFLDQSQPVDDDAKSFKSCRSSLSRSSMESALQEPQKSSHLSLSRSSSLASHSSTSSIASLVAPDSTTKASSDFSESSENIVETLNEKVNQFFSSKSDYSQARAKYVAEKQEVKNSIVEGIEKLQNFRQSLPPTSKLTTNEEARLNRSIALLQERLDEIAPRS